MKRTLIVALALSLLAVACDQKKSGDTAPEEGQTQGVPTISAADDAPKEEAAAPSEAPSTELSLPFQSRPMDGVITAGQPTAEQFAQLKAAGVKKVINLRAESEPSPFDEDAEALRQKMVYVRIPIAGPQDVTPENAKKLAEAMKDVDGDVLVHCGSSNRVGALLALKAKYVDGMSKQEAMEIGEKAGLKSLKSIVDQKLTTE